MKAMDSHTEKQAIGIQKGSLMKIVCAFDIETWEQLRGMATARQISFAEQVRRLVEIGLESDGVEEIARKADEQAAAYDLAAARCPKPQSRTVPEPQLSHLKATHWRILAKFVRGSVNGQLTQPRP